MIPFAYTEILLLIQALDGDVGAPILLVYLILKIRRSNEIMGELSKSLKSHTEGNDEVFKKNDNKFMGLVAFLIRTNGKLNRSDKKELSSLLRV